MTAVDDSLTGEAHTKLVGVEWVAKKREGASSENQVCSTGV